MTTASQILLKFMVIFLLTWQAIFQISNNMAMDVVFIFISVLYDFAESAKLLAEKAFPNTLLKAHMLHAEKCNSTYEYSDCQECNGE